MDVKEKGDLSVLFHGRGGDRTQKKEGREKKVPEEGGQEIINIDGGEARVSPC